MFAIHFFSVFSRFFPAEFDARAKKRTQKKEKKSGREEKSAKTSPKKAKRRKENEEKNARDGKARRATRSRIPAIKQDAPKVREGPSERQVRVRRFRSCRAPDAISLFPFQQEKGSDGGKEKKERGGFGNFVSIDAEQESVGG